MNIRSKDYGCPEEKFVIELPAKYVEVFDYIWENIWKNIDEDEDVNLTKQAENMLARWRYARQFVHPSSVEGYSAWQKYLQD